MGALYITGREWNWDHFESRTRSGVLGKKKDMGRNIKEEPYSHSRVIIKSIILKCLFSTFNMYTILAES